MKKLVYLASPYTHEDAAVMDARCKEAQKEAARLMLDGFAVFSPIAHSHGLADYIPEALRRDAVFWLEQDFPLLARCDELRVLCLPGWEESVGVRAEIEFAHARGIPVSYLHEK